MFFKEMLCKKILVWLLLLSCNKIYAQVASNSGNLYDEITSIISSMPGDSGDVYSEPNASQLLTWENALNLLTSDDYSRAADSANLIGYQLTEFTDNTTGESKLYYILHTIDSNYWGTYVYYPEYCRPLVIQSPHSKRDANTGNQGVFVFQKTKAMFFFLNGTHRCNSSIASSCSGTTTACTGSSDPYPVSDLAHTTQSLFQKSTEVLLNGFTNAYFIQLHGFTKLNTDPYLILSNGTQETPSLDYMLPFMDNLYLEDTSLTFRVAHIDTTWTRLRGFWNTQGRMINNSGDPCNTTATSTTGRFFHVEQERIKLRSDSVGWNKIANALVNTFECEMIPSSVNYISTNTLKIHPNPTTGLLKIIRDDKYVFYETPVKIYNKLGQDISATIHLNNSTKSEIVFDLSSFSPGIYFLQLDLEMHKIIKK